MNKNYIYIFTNKQKLINMTKQTKKISKKYKIKMKIENIN